MLKLKNGKYLNINIPLRNDNNMNWENGNGFLIDAQGYTLFYSAWKLHNLSGAAIISPGGNDLEWRYNGERINVSSQKEFERYLKIKAFW